MRYYYITRESYNKHYAIIIDEIIFNLSQTKLTFKFE